MKKTNLVLAAGLVFLLVGLAAYSTLGPCTIRSCLGYSTGYEITGITLTRIDFYDGCNWCSISSLIVSAPVGAMLIMGGALGRVYQMSE